MRGNESFESLKKKKLTPQIALKISPCLLIITYNLNTWLIPVDGYRKSNSIHLVLMPSVTTLFGEDPLLFPHEEEFTGFVELTVEPKV